MQNEQYAPPPFQMYSMLFPPKCTVCSSLPNVQYALPSQMYSMPFPPKCAVCPPPSQMYSMSPPTPPFTCATSVLANQNAACDARSVLQVVVEPEEPHVFGYFGRLQQSALHCNPRQRQLFLDHRSGGPLFLILFCNKCLPLQRSAAV
jgi:hypothetical protein